MASVFVPLPYNEEVICYSPKKNSGLIIAPQKFVPSTFPETSESKMVYKHRDSGFQVDRCRSAAVGVVDVAGPAGDRCNCS